MSKERAVSLTSPSGGGAKARTYSQAETTKSQAHTPDEEAPFPFCLLFLRTGDSRAFWPIPWFKKPSE